MNQEFANLCSIARKNSGYSQEDVAEIFGVSVRSISDYENAKTPVPDDIVAKMIRVYDALWLGYVHLSMNTKVGALILPDVEMKELASSILNLQVQMKKANDIQYDIAEVGSDNKIELHEVTVYRTCIDVINTLIGAAFSVILAPTKKETALAATNTASRLKKIIL